MKKKRSKDGEVGNQHRGVMTNISKKFFKSHLAAIIEAACIYICAYVKGA